jgi:chloramphenicol 3-O-phosphotransferase
VDAPAPIILLNGASSAGKSTLAKELQARLPVPFWHYLIDHLLAAQVLPRARIDSGEFRWPQQREAFFDGFHRSIAAFAGAGNPLIVEHIVETGGWVKRRPTSPSHTVLGTGTSSARRLRRLTFWPARWPTPGRRGRRTAPSAG